MLLDLLAQLSDVEVGSCSDRNAVGVGIRDANNIQSRVIADDDDDDDTFAHSSGRTIKSSQQSSDSVFSNVSNMLGHVTKSPLCVSYVEQLESAASPHFELPVDSNSTTSVKGYSCFNSTNVGHGSKMICGTSSASDLQTFLSELGLGKYAAIFTEQDVDLPMFLTLNEDDLKEIGIR